MFISNVDNLNDVALIESNGSILIYSDLYKNVSEFATFFGVFMQLLAEIA